MTFDDVCLLFDTYSTVEKQVQINSEYLAASNIIYSDGTVHQNINGEGCIHITSIDGDPTYIMFVDPAGDVSLTVYKYIHDTKFKEIVSNVDLLREKTGIKHKSQRQKKEPKPKQKQEVVHSPNDLPQMSNDPFFKEINISEDLKSCLVDINQFKCTQCNGDVKFSKKRNTDTIVAKCTNCKTEFYMVPSKYYVISAKKIVYGKGKASKTVDIVV